MSIAEVKCTECGHEFDVEQGTKQSQCPECHRMLILIPGTFRSKKLRMEFIGGGCLKFHEPKSTTREKDLLTGLIELRDGLPSTDNRLDKAIDYLREQVAQQGERH